MSQVISLMPQSIRAVPLARTAPLHPQSGLSQGITILAAQLNEMSSTHIPCSFSHDKKKFGTHVHSSFSKPLIRRKRFEN